ncbi:pyroglutamyl-peptidase I [Pseudalkalibacillus berkeleyi]|uniref:Pyrrolidone-carboxylate peptidase n=1 Tax=Pseudalkalibacillus berkeleyi TaxID=1069813 RepID=A0ABS9H3U5_9BACL|nr:pyroglutamyl-peptidase I [Pseudalkalibacillus berkeleyi]MCF6138746.1 pyroglutamyl-peptidase I [Pseudalkalibacillus berkeleyi]
MKKLLLTGFEPFLDHAMNPTESIVRNLDGKRVGEFEVVGRVLPVVFDEAAPQLLTHLKEIEPDAVIALGLAAGRNKITPERVAINVNDGVKDNAGQTPVDEVIVEGGPAAYFSTLPIRQIVDHLHEERIPTAISNSAGTYLCNNVMYLLLHELDKRDLKMPAGFIHVPASFELSIGEESLPAWPLPTIQKAVEAAIKTLAV